MSISKKLAVVAGALALVVVAPAAAEAKARPRTFLFTGGTNVSKLNVTCAQGATQGTASTTLKVKATRKYPKGVTSDFLGNSLGQSTKVVASYPGGSQTLFRFESWYTINKNKTKFSFPCPMTAVGGTSTFEIVLQPYRGSNPIGTAAKVNVTLTRVGQSS
jgi:hypothetical protein